MNIRTRFAPSPTGYLHIGGLRTALFAYLFAKKHNGTFMLRIEDTDRERLVDGATKNILEALQWAGFSPDEGVVLKDDMVTQVGQYGPYIQSERKDKGVYKKMIKGLVDAGHAYYAFDTAEEIDVMRAEQQKNKQPIRYDREHMRNSLTLPQKNVQTLLDAHTPYVIRMKVPEGETQFDDQIRGTITIDNKEIDDQILMKSDGFPTYHFAVVVDDHLMNITHVIRGEEWIPSTPKHIILYNMLGWTVPTFAHLPLLINEQKQKLSKRHGDVSVQDFIQKGYLPQALVNFIAFLGWNPGTEQELFSLRELIDAFSFEKVAKAAAVFNREKLNWFNAQYIRQLDREALFEHVYPFLQNAGVVDHDTDVQFIKDAILLEQERSQTLLEIVQNTGFLFARELSYDKDLLTWKKSTLEDAKQKLKAMHDFLQTYEKTWDEQSLHDNVVQWIKANEYGVGDVLWPTRVALSGQKNSPGPFEIMSVLKKEKVLERLMSAIDNIG